MRVSIEGEAAQSLRESASLHGELPQVRLAKAVFQLDFLERLETQGQKILVLDPKEGTERHLLVSDRSPLDERDKDALWEEHAARWSRELDS